MAFTIADQYYLKALEDYDYNFEVVIENLQYALSYNPEHPGANYLMGKFYMEQFQNFGLAENYFVASSMAADTENLNTCEAYAWLMIKSRRYAEAGKLIAYASGIVGADLSKFKRKEAVICERQQKFSSARTLLEEAIMESFDSDYVEFLEDEISRIDKKSNFNTVKSHYQS